MTAKSRTAFELLESSLRERFPRATISIDKAESAKGTDYLSVVLDGHEVAVQWRQDSGFGITCAPKVAYGALADEVYKDEEAAYGRIISLLLSKTYTSPPEPVRISDLRKELGLSQESLAALLNVKQASISKLERRSDFLVSSLRNLIRSMGGELRIIAKFSNGEERTLEFDDAASKE